MAAAQRAFETRMSRVVGIQSEPCTTATCDALPRIRKVNAVLEDLSRGRTRATAPAAGDRRCNLVCAPPGPSRLLAQSIATGQEPVDVDAPERSDADAGQLAFRESFALSGRTSY